MEQALYLSQFVKIQWSVFGSALWPTLQSMYYLRLCLLKDFVLTFSQQQNLIQFTKGEPFRSTPCGQKSGGSTRWNWCLVSDIFLMTPNHLCMVHKAGSFYSTCHWSFTPARLVVLECEMNGNAFWITSPYLTLNYPHYTVCGANCLLFQITLCTSKSTMITEIFLLMQQLALVTQLEILRYICITKINLYYNLHWWVHRISKFKVYK